MTQINPDKEFRDLVEDRLVEFFDKKISEMHDENSNKKFKYPEKFSFMDGDNKITIKNHFINVAPTKSNVLFCDIGEKVYIDQNNKWWPERWIDLKIQGHDSLEESNYGKPSFKIGFEFIDHGTKRIITARHMVSDGWMYALDGGGSCNHAYIVSSINHNNSIYNDIQKLPLYNQGFTFVDYFGRTRTINSVCIKGYYNCDEESYYVIDNPIEKWKCSSLEEFLKEE